MLWLNNQSKVKTSRSFMHQADDKRTTMTTVACGSHEQFTFNLANVVSKPNFVLKVFIRNISSSFGTLSVYYLVDKKTIHDVTLSLNVFCVLLFVCL